MPSTSLRGIVYDPVVTLDVTFIASASAIAISVSMRTSAAPCAGRSRMALT
jgi:hypothetical protein